MASTTGALAGNVTVQLGTTVNANLNVMNIENITADNQDSNTLIGLDQLNNWLINQNNGGSVEEVRFSNFHNLSGGTGTANDIFTLSEGVTIAGLIDGAGGAGDRLTMLGSTNRIVELGIAVNGNINVNNIEMITASGAANNTLIDTSSGKKIGRAHV